MADTITLETVERVVIDLKKERARINSPRLFNKRQRRVLLSAVDAFEQGNIQEMIDIMQHPETKNLFEYSVWEFLDDAFYRIVQDFCLERRVWKRVTA